MDSNPIHHLSLPKKMKCSFLGYVQLLMISRAIRWTQTPSATPLQPLKWNAHFWITFNFWWSAGLVDGLEPHPPPVSSLQNEMLIFWLCSTSDDWPGWLMDSNPIHQLFPANKMKCSFLDYIQLLMSSRACRWTWTPSTTPLQPKNEMLIFWLCSTSDDQPGWLMDSNPICHPSPAKKMKCSYFDYVQLLMISQPGQWTQTPSITLLQPKKMKCLFLDFVQLLMISQAGWWTLTPFTTPLHPKKWNAHFRITFNFQWSAGLVDGLEPHPPPVSSQKMKCSFFNYVQLLMTGQAVQWTRTPSSTLLQPKKMKCLFLDYIFFWWSARLIYELEPHLPPLSYQKNETLIFVLHSTSDVGQTGQWTWTPSTTPLQPKKWNASFLDYAQLLMIGQASRWTRTQYTTHLQPKKWNPRFCITLNFWWSALLVDGLEPHLPPLSSQKNEMLIFGLRSTSDEWPGWVLDSNPIHHRSSPKKMKCSFLDYVQRLMISRAARWTWNLSTPHLQPTKWNSHILIMFNFWWLAGLFNRLEPHPPPLSTQKNEIPIFIYHSTSDVGQTGQWTQTPSTTPLQPIKWNPSFWIMFTSDDQPGWLMDSNPICHPSPAKKSEMLLLWITLNFWWLAGLSDGLKPHPPSLSSQ